MISVLYHFTAQTVQFGNQNTTTYLHTKYSMSENIDQRLHLVSMCIHLMLKFSSHHKFLNQKKMQKSSQKNNCATFETFAKICPDTTKICRKCLSHFKVFRSHVTRCRSCSISSQRNCSLLYCKCFLSAGFCLGKSLVLVDL